jgi:hypothetical protein
VIRAVTEFEADMKEMTKLCKISDEKNVYVLVEPLSQAVY